MGNVVPFIIGMCLSSILFFKVSTSFKWRERVWNTFFSESNALSAYSYVDLSNCSWKNANGYSHDFWSSLTSL